MNSGVGGIAYADENLAVIYECDEVQEGGTCVPSETTVEVLSRSPEPLTEEEKIKLIPMARRLCFDEHDFHEMAQDGKSECIVRWCVYCKLEFNGWSDL